MTAHPTTTLEIAYTRASSYETYTTHSTIAHVPTTENRSQPALSFSDSV
jgi:hypothetical protein